MSRKEYALFLQLALRIFSFHLKMKTALEDEKYFPDGFTLETRWKLLLQIKLFSDFFCILTIFADDLEMFCSDEMLNKLTQLHDFFDVNLIDITIGSIRQNRRVIIEMYHQYELSYRKVTQVKRFRNKNDRH